MADSCCHLTKFKAEGGDKTLDVLHKYKIQVGLGNLVAPRCTTCGTLTGRLFACLYCVHFACSDHLKSHCQHLNHTHPLALELSCLHIYCTECNNYIYDFEWEQKLSKSKRAKMDMPEEVGTPDETDDETLNATQPSKSFDSQYDGSSASSSSASDLGSNTENTYAHSVDTVQAEYENDMTPCTWNPKAKGFKNLGNTCYMGTILQCMVHNPLIRNWFLSGMHQTCSVHAKRLYSFMTQAQTKSHQKSSSSSSSYSDSGETFDTEDLCLSCEFWDIVNSMFGESCRSIIPNKFIYTLWRKAESCASYEQQDAHEFFITLTNLMHTELVKCHYSSELKCATTDEDSCKCIIHKSFCGLLESDLTCLSCKNSSTSNNIFTDISLDIPMNQEATTLAACLDLFTSPEVLSKTEQFYCTECKRHCDSTKQLSISRLPNVLCIHFKRFAHNSVRHTLSKIDTKIEFPRVFDMSPWTKNGKKDRPTQKTFYELYAVLNHIGRIDGGHYTCYVRCGKQWFFCNDTAVAKVEISQVRKSQAYMLFYMKTKLDYEQDPSPKIHAQKRKISQ